MSGSVNVSLNQQMVLDRLYELLSKLDRTTTDGREASALVESLITLVTNAPSDARKGNFPKIGTGRR